MFQHEISQLNLAQLKAGEKRWIGNLQGSAAALLFKEIGQQNQRLFVIVARNKQHLAQLESELEFYGVKPTIFPDWEILPYDRLSPHQDIVSERLGNFIQYAAARCIVGFRNHFGTTCCTNLMGVGRAFRYSCWAKV